MAKYKDTKTSRSNGRVSTMLTTHLYQQAESTLFTSNEEAERDRKIAEKAELFCFLNKKAVFNNSTIRTLFALCYWFTKSVDDDILRFSKMSSEQQNIEVTSYITKNIAIKDFVKFIFGSRGLHDRAIGVIRDIITLANITVSWQYEIKDKEGNKQKWRKIAPFINYEIDLPADSGKDTNGILEDIYNQGMMSITIGRPLLHNLEKRFAYIPEKLITEWGKDGTQNELFPMLVNELLSLHGNYKYYAHSAIKRVQIEQVESGAGREACEHIIKGKTKELMTCRLKFITIAENSVFDYTTR